MYNRNSSKRISNIFSTINGEKENVNEVSYIQMVVPREKIFLSLYILIYSI